MSIVVQGIAALAVRSVLQATLFTPALSTEYDNQTSTSAHSSFLDDKTHGLEIFGCLPISWRGWKGTAEVVETVRKVYLVVG